MNKIINFSEASILPSSVADPYHFDTDPDPGFETNRYEFGSRTNFDTDQKRIKYQENLQKVIKNAQIPCFVCLFYLTISFLKLII